MLSPVRFGADEYSTLQMYSSKIPTQNDHRDGDGIIAMTRRGMTRSPTAPLLESIDTYLTIFDIPM